MNHTNCNITLDVDRVGLTCIYSIVFSFGLPANVLSLWGLYQLQRSGQEVRLVLLVNLLVSDLLQLLTLPLWMVYLHQEHRWLLGPLACDFVSYIFYVNLYASVGFLCLIALDRYLAIIYPLRSRGVRRVRVAVLLSMTIWIFTLFFCMSGLYPSVYKDNLCLEQYPVHTRYASFKIGTIVLGFLLPCTVLGYTSSGIAVDLRNSPSIRDHERHKIVGTLFIITVIFVVVFGPYHLVGAYKFIAFFIMGDSCALERELFLCYRLCYGLTSLNNLLDPLLYIFMYHNVRHTLKQSLVCVRCHTNAPERAA